MSTSIVAEMQQYYARRAAVYDDSMGYNDSATLDRLEPVIESLRGRLENRRVLEIACGPGFWTQQVSPVVASLMATDCNDSVLAEARRKPMDWAKVVLSVADAYDLSAIGASFDGALAVDWLAHVPLARLVEFLENLHARLEPGSRVVFCDQLPGPHSLTGTFDAEGNHLQTRSLPDGSRYRVIKHFFSAAEYRALFAPFTRSVDVETFGDSRRVVVGYSLEKP